jgi:hypothetical protein
VSSLLSLAEVDDSADRRDADEAAVISLLANQLSHQNSKNLATCGKKDAFAPQGHDDDDFPGFTGLDDDYFAMDDDEADVDTPSEIMITTKSMSSPSKKTKVKVEPAKTAKKKKSSLVAAAKAAITCPVEGCSFVTRYNKDLMRHERTHTGEWVSSSSFLSSLAL